MKALGLNVQYKSAVLWWVSATQIFRCLLLTRRNSNWLIVVHRLLLNWEVMSAIGFFYCDFERNMMTNFRLVFLLIKRPILFWAQIMRWRSRFATIIMVVRSLSIREETIISFLITFLLINMFMLFFSFQTKMFISMDF